jgi:hypothetical protein
MKVAYKVLQELKNGGRIAGRRRALNEVFEADESELHFLELEGVVEKVAPAAAKAAKAPSEAQA